MDGNTNARHSSGLQRQLATLKLASRLLGHELHAQGGSKTVQLSRETVAEVQTTIDLFIEEATKRFGQSGSPYGSAPDTQLVPARN